ncbi:MAG: hypothetical protein R3F13_01875 [Prosthecobacter sp.]
MKAKLLTCAALTSALASGLAGTPAALKVVESHRRMDPTGAGSFHRTGLLREMQNTRRNAEKAGAKKTAKSKS